MTNNVMITLTPSHETFVGGTKTYVQDDPRTPQEFWLIWPAIDSIVVNSMGTTRKLDFILVGDWDAEVDIGDHWDRGSQKYVITWIAPFNGYEVKCGGVSIGEHP